MELSGYCHQEEAGAVWEAKVCRAELWEVQVPEGTRGRGGRRC